MLHNDYHRNFQLINNLLSIGMMPLIGWLNNSIAGISSPGPSGTDLTVIRLYVHQIWYQCILIVLFINLIYTFTCPLLWWWYDDDTAWSMFMFLQNLLNLSEIKLPPAPDITFFGKAYSEEIVLHASIKLSADRSAIFLMTGNVLS